MQGFLEKGRFKVYFLVFFYQNDIPDSYSEKGIVHVFGFSIVNATGTKPVLDLNCMIPYINI